MLIGGVLRSMKFTFSYTGLRVVDLEANVRFFRDGLGMKETSRSDVAETGGKLVYLQSEGKEHPIELNWYPPGSPHATKYVAGEALDHLFFEMEPGVQLEDAIRHLERHGGKLRGEPFREGKGRLAYIDSPDGHTIELFQRD